MTVRRDDATNDERDAYLRAALRHAPDRDAAPPANLSEQILAAARRSVGYASDRGSWIRRLRAALAATLDALTRPAGAAAFASLVLVTVIGVMWREGAPPEALPERAQAPDVAPPTPTAVPSPKSATETPASDAAGTLSRPAAELSGPARARIQSDAGAAKPAVEPKRRGATSSADAPRAEAAKAAEPSSTTIASAEGARAASPHEEARKATPATPAAPAGAQAPMAAAPPPPPARATPTPPAVADATAPAAPRAAPLAAAPPAPASLRSSLASAPSDPLAALVTELAREAADARSATSHRWQRGNAAPLPHGPSAQAWLAELQRATRGVWQLQRATAAGDQALVLSNEGGVVGRLELTESGVLWHSASAPNASWRATLPDETLKRLRDALVAWVGR